MEQEHASTSLTRPEAETLLKVEVVALLLELFIIMLSSIIMVLGGSRSRYESEGVSMKIDCSHSKARTRIHVSFWTMQPQLVQLKVHQKVHALVREGGRQPQTRGRHAIFLQSHALHSRLPTVATCSELHLPCDKQTH